jgi:hypothetical protein
MYNLRMNMENVGNIPFYSAPYSTSLDEVLRTNTKHSRKTFEIKKRVNIYVGNETL